MSNFFDEIKFWPINEKRVFAIYSMIVASADGEMTDKKKGILYKVHTEILGFKEKDINESTLIMQKDNYFREMSELLKKMSDRKLENMAYFFIYLSKADGNVHEKEIAVIKSFLIAAGYPDSVANKIIDEGIKKIDAPK